MVNQGLCGSCWTHSITASISINHAVATDKKPVALSRQQLMDYTPLGNEPGQLGTLNRACFGGDPSSGFDYIIHNGGIMKENDYRYKMISSETCRFDHTKPVVKVSKVQIITPGDEIALKAAVAKHGSVTVVATFNMFANTYTSNIYDNDNYLPVTNGHAANNCWLRNR